MRSIMYANELGEGNPVLLVHGWQLNGKAEELDFEPIFGKTSGLRRVYVDLPGMGSTPLNELKNLDDIFHQLVQFVDARFGTSRFSLIGSSCGGYLAHALAQKYIGQIDGLLLRVPLIEPRDSKRDLDAVEPLVRNEQLRSGLLAEDKKLLGNVLIQTPAYVEALKAKFHEAYIPAEKAANAEVCDVIRADPERYQLSFPLENPSAKCFAPTLILCGRQDEVVGYRDSLRLLALYPRSTFVVLDRGTHAFPVTETNLFEALVHDWVLRVREWQEFRIDKSHT